MLYLDSAMQIGGLTVYQDYNKKDQFYFFPGSPQLAMEAGQPMFQLLAWRDVGEGGTAPSGGGFLTMTTDLRVSPAVLDRVQRELSARVGGPARLAPVPVKGGSVRVTALDSGRAGAEGAGAPRFVENVVAHGTPSLYGDQRAAFTAELSEDGATLMKAALEGEGATPVVLVYELQYVGLMPAYDVTIKIKFRQSYEHLRTRTQMNTLWFKSDIDNEMEALRKSGAIEIEEVVYETETQEQTAARMTRLNALAKELAQWSFFKPALNPGAVLATDRGTLTAYDVTPDAKAITTGLTSDSRAALTGVGSSAAAGAPRRPGVAVATDAVEEGGGTSPAGGDGAGADRPATPAPTGDQPETAVEAWNRAGRPQGAYLLRSLEQLEQQDIEYKLRQVSAVERTIAPQGQIRLLPGAADLPGRIVEVDVDADFFKTIEGEISTAADLEAAGVSSMVVKLRYGKKPDGSRWKDTAEVVLSAAGDKGTYRFAMDREGSREVEHQVVLHYKPEASIGDESTKEETPWKATTTRNLDINPLTYSSVIPVQVEVAMVDWEAIQQVQAHVGYKDTDSGIEAADTRILTRAAPRVDVMIRPKDPEKRDVTVRAVFFDMNGETDTVTLEQPGDEPFILNQPRGTTAIVDVRLADALARYERVTVQLARPGGDPPQVERTVNLSAERTETQWSFRKDAVGGAEYAYRVTAFLKDGAVREDEWKRTDNPLLIVGDRAAGVLAVQVMFLGTLADGGFRLARLKLSYPDAPSWADPDVEQVFRTGEEEFTWRVPMERADATSYTYEVTWFGTDGTRKTTGPVTTSDEILLLDPLAP